MKKYLIIVLVLNLMNYAASNVAFGANSKLQGNADSVSVIISAADGGTITTPDGKMTLTIPAGALNEDTEITVTPVKAKEGTVYEFQPDGLVLNTPATATVEIDLADQPELKDEKGNPLDIKNIVPDVMLFLLNSDGTAEMLKTSQVESDEDNSTIKVTTQIPHFTSFLSAVGNSFYLYMYSLGTHYVGSSFKSDVTVRYLGYESTSSYLNMSMTNKVLSITVTKINFDVNGVISIMSPNPITRNDRLSRRGQESSTRPKFICDEVGNGTVTATVDVTGVVEVTFQPENRTRAFTVNLSESTTRMAKCIAPIISMLPAIGVAVGGTALALVGLSQGDSTATGTGTDDTGTDTGGDTGTDTGGGTTTPSASDLVGTYNGDGGCGFGSADVNSATDTVVNVTFPGNSARDLTGSNMIYTGAEFFVLDACCHTIRMTGNSDYNAFDIFATNPGGGSCSEAFNRL